jgi:hypothetical protein
MSTAADYTKTNQVRLAAQQLRAALNAPPDRRAGEIRAATDWLTAAADQHENDAARARQGFLAQPVAQQPGRTPADIMSVVISDLNVANTLMAAGNALQETEAKPDPKLLDEALIGMQQGATLDQETTLAFQFKAQPVHSADLPSARDAFRQRTGAVLNDLVSQAKDACSNVIGGINKLDGQKAIEALAQLGGPLAELPQIGILFRKGIEKMRNALDFLKQMLDKGMLGEIKDKLTAIWSQIAGGTWANALLGWTFGREQTESLLPKVAGSDKYTVEQVDRSTDDLAPLTERFASEMKWARTVTAAIGFGDGLAVLAGVTAGTSALFLGGAYLLVLAAIIVIGRDCAGTGALFHGHRGVRVLIEGLVTP